MTGSSLDAIASLPSLAQSAIISSAGAACKALSRATWKALFAADGDPVLCIGSRSSQIPSALIHADWMKSARYTVRLTGELSRDDDWLIQRGAPGCVRLEVSREWEAAHILAIPDKWPSLEHIAIVEIDCGRVLDYPEEEESNEESTAVYVRILLSKFPNVTFSARWMYPDPESPPSSRITCEWYIINRGFRYGRSHPGRRPDYDLSLPTCKALIVSDAHVLRHITFTQERWPALKEVYIGCIDRDWLRSRAFAGQCAAVRPCHDLLCLTHEHVAAFSRLPNLNVHALLIDDGEEVWPWGGYLEIPPGWVVKHYV